MKNETYRDRLLLFAVVLWMNTAALTSVAKAEANGPGGLTRYAFTEIHMGAPWKILLYAPSEDVANRAAQAAYERVEALNRILSDYEPTSELSRLSSTAPSNKPVPLSDDLWKVLEISQKLAERTGGAFDVTIGPLTKLWRRARQQKEMPRADLLQAAKDATDFRALVLDAEAKTAKLTKPHMQLDLGGIGMGYAVDEALKVLKREGIESALIDASGDIGVSNAPPGERGWRIGIEPPAGEGTPSRFVLLANYAITTSGDAFQAVELNGKRYSHVIDPRTGLGVTRRSAVTVIAPDCTTADSYAKPISILGPKEGFKLIESMPGAAAFVQIEPQAAETAEGAKSPFPLDSFESLRFAQFLAPADKANPNSK